MQNWRAERFRRRHFPKEIIVLCVRWYLRYCLSYRDLEEIMAERGVGVDHSTIARWVVHYAPLLNQLIRREMRTPNRSWRVDETYIRVAGRWTYLCGSARREVLYLVLKQAARLALLGVAIGLAGAFLLTRLIASLLYGVDAFDPITFIGVAILSLLVGLAACAIPAWRATHVDPVVALRYE